jgi:tetratricopeptide (TPR) repeat protein
MMKRSLSIALFVALLFISGRAFPAPDPGSSPLSPLPGINEQESEADQEEDALGSEDEPQEEPREDEDSPAPLTAESVTKEIETAVQENSADDLLNLATEVKLSAESILDLTKVIAYCVEAEKKGLEGDGLEFCRQLKLSSQLERGLAMSRIFMDDSRPFHQYPESWSTLRDMALEDLETAIGQFPDLALAQLVVGRLLMLPEGNEKKACESLDAAIRLAKETDPDIYAEALKYRALTVKETGRRIDLLTMAADSLPEDPEILNLLAASLVEVNQEEKALETIEKAIAVEPDTPRFKRTKAAVLAAMGKKDEALKLYDEAGTLGESDLMSKIDRGEFLVSIGEYDQAIDLYTKMLQEVPLVSVFYLRAAAYLQKKEFTNALKDVNRAIGMNPSFSEALRLKALIYIQQERYADAIPLLEKMRRSDPNDEDITAQLSYTMAQNDEFTAGMTRLDSLLETKPDSLSLLRAKADMYLMYGRWNDASTVYEKILVSYPRDVGSLNNYAWLLATCPEDAVRRGDRALELASQAAEQTNYRETYILSTLAAAYAETGDFAKAIEYAEKGVLHAESEGDERIDEFRNELESYKEGKPWREEAQKTGDASDPLPEEGADFF